MTSPGLIAPAAGLPVTGQRWREKFDVIAQDNAPQGEFAWRGTAVDGGHAVVLRAFRIPDAETRAQVWAKVGGIDSPHLQRARFGQQLGEWRVEVADAPGGVPLAEWRGRQTSVDTDTVKAILAQLAEAVTALHAFEIVHLALRPEAIFIRENGASLECLVAGLEAMTTFDRKQPVPAIADPFYCPPEALGLNVHVPGPGLCAWDWWSLGRIVQELVLGKHIAAFLANATSLADPALAQRAEALLQEADPKEPRAGAVEKMPGLDPSLQLLLRGLLTSSKDARWTGDNVDRWVRGLPVKEHYDTPRIETHFRWRGRPVTVSEMATILQTADAWLENSVQLFEPTTPGTLAHFLRWSVSQSLAHEQLTSALELADSLPLKLSSPAAQREAVTMIALLQLSAGRLVWRGRPFEGETPAAMIDELGAADAVMVLRALGTRSTALQVERIDAAAGRLLTELGKTVGDVEGLLKRHGWLAANDSDGAARLHRLALEPIPALRARRDALAERFAGSDHPAMEKLFKAQNVGRSELVTLAWVADIADRCKFYSHAEAARRRAQELRTRGLEISDALAWAQLERALNVGCLVLSGWGWFFLAWISAGLAVVLLWPGPTALAAALVPGLLALGLRMAVAPRQQKALRERFPDARWTWRDGPARCRRELRVAGRSVARPALEEELATITAALAAMTNVQPKPQPIPGLPRFGFIRLAGVLSWVLVVAVGALAGWRVVTHPPSAKEMKSAWAPPAVAKPKPEAEVAKLAKVDEGEVKVSWPFKPGDNAVKLAIRSVQPASAAQSSFAAKHGRELVAPYRPDSISTLIVMPVPAGDDAAVMLFDGKRGEPVNQQVYVLEFRPIARTWVELAGRKGVFLDQ